jgi:hypothetical protein
MKKYLFLLLALCAIPGCKKPLSYNYAFDISGTVYQGNNYTAYYQYDTAARLYEFAADFYIGPVVDTNYVQVSFSGNSYIVAGNYYSGVVNPYNTTCSFAYVKNHVYYSNVSGIVQILQIDTVGHSIKGNFQFKASSSAPGDSVIVTNGAFSGINYVVQ